MFRFQLRFVSIIGVTCVPSLSATGSKIRDGFNLPGFFCALESIFDVDRELDQIIMLHSISEASVAMSTEVG